VTITLLTYSSYTSQSIAVATTATFIPVYLAQENSQSSFVDLACLESCVKRLKKNKATGRYGIMNEHIMFGNQVLYVHLSLLCGSLLKHSYVPDEFYYGMVIPLLKNKHGATTSDMYRGITLSSRVSKLFEMVLIEMFGNSLQSDTLVVYNPRFWATSQSQGFISLIDS